ncbi:hypothetical protein GWL_29460 [Herbaspirillum sp. GW103]|nr:hypothetical protein GWL_29460 [Herbaspirillum sp. GW103]
MKSQQWSQGKRILGYLNSLISSKQAAGSPTVMKGRLLIS